MRNGGASARAEGVALLSALFPKLRIFTMPSAVRKETFFIIGIRYIFGFSIKSSLRNMEDASFRLPDVTSWASHGGKFEFVWIFGFCLSTRHSLP